MKKILGALLLASGSMLSAQQVGLTAGLASITAKAKAQGYNYSESRAGGYIGLYGDFGISNGFKFQPMLNFVLADGVKTLQLPLLLKYYATSALNIQFGPQVNFDLSEVPNEIKNYYSTTSFGLAVGAGYDFTPKFTLEARFNPQLSNSLKNTGGADVSAKAHYFNLGVGYKF